MNITYIYGFDFFYFIFFFFLFETKKKVWGSICLDLSRVHAFFANWTHDSGFDFDGDDPS